VYVSKPQEFIEENFKGNILKFELESVLFSGKSDFQKVEVVQTKHHGRMLLNDGCVMLSERDEFVYHEMMAHVALFTHPNPKKVLIIGGGDGGTAREVLRHPSVQKCDMVEIDDMVVDACREHLPVTAVGMQESPRFKLYIEDGLKFVRETKETYDVVLVDSTDPVGPAQPLFGPDFYQDIFKILAADGLVLSQAESPFYAAEMQIKLAQILSGIFPICRFMNFSNLTYPGGLWSFSVASKRPHPLNDFDSRRVEKAKLKTQYYNSKIHHAAFALPEFQLERLQMYLKDR
jgi:spermidine synthase